MRKTIYIILIAFVPAFAMAQGFPEVDSVLASVERNNKDLQALKFASEASALDIQAQNNIEQSLGVEYSPFWAPGVQGVASSEMVVRMGFDFPTKYAARAKSVKYQQTAVNMEFMEARRELLLEVKLLCFDLIRLNKERELLVERMGNAEKLLGLVEKNFAVGGANVLDLNKVKMEMMDLRTKLADNAAARAAALGSLKAFNGNEDMEFTVSEYPSFEAIDAYESFYADVMASDMSIMTAEANVDVTEQEIKVNKQNWVPEIEVGYRRNTAVGEAVNGFLVGASFPIFAGRNHTKVAKAQHQQAVAELESVKIRTEAQVAAQYNELVQFRSLLEVYDEELMLGTIEALDKAVVSGSLSIIDYYTEADRVYGSLISLIDVENRYHQLLATVYKYKL